MLKWDDFEDSNMHWLYPFSKKKKNENT